ncbi:MAG: hypothetical protein IPO77_00630 [Acidobacteria bacterium]|nr:hypothetical protein [Acidobacteriota bacterium]
MERFLLSNNYAQAQTVETPARLRLSFISVGGGIDAKAKQQTDEFLIGYESKHGQPLAKSVVHWGREGKLDYCFALKELAEAEQTAFIRQIRSLTERSRRVHVYENSKCPKKSR